MLIEKDVERIKSLSRGKNVIKNRMDLAELIIKIKYTKEFKIKYGSIENFVDNEGIKLTSGYIGQLIRIRNNSIIYKYIEKLGFAKANFLLSNNAVTEEYVKEACGMTLAQIKEKFGKNGNEINKTMLIMTLKEVVKELKSVSEKIERLLIALC